MKVDIADEIELKLVEDLKGKDAFRTVIKRSQPVVTIGNETKVKVAPAQTIDPSLLF
jgi:hypothetical protein